jgi:hypothetical protein
VLLGRSTLSAARIATGFAASLACNSRRSLEGAHSLSHEVDIPIIVSADALHSALFNGVANGEIFPRGNEQNVPQQQVAAAILQTSRGLLSLKVQELLSSTMVSKPAKPGAGRIVIVVDTAGADRRKLAAVKRCLSIFAAQTQTSVITGECHVRAVRYALKHIPPDGGPRSGAYWRILPISWWEVLLALVVALPTYVAAALTVLSIALCVAWRIFAPIPKLEELEVVIPVKGQAVSFVSNIEVHASLDARAVYAIIKPKQSANDYWVQKQLTRNPNRPEEWQGVGQFGLGDQDIGKEFEILVQATNEGWISRMVRGAYLHQDQHLTQLYPRLSNSLSNDLVSVPVTRSSVRPWAIDVTTVPPRGEGPDSQGTIAGRVTGSSTNGLHLVIYSCTDIWYVQPYDAHSSTPIRAGGWFEADIHLGYKYAVLLVDNDFWPVPTVLPNRLSAVAGSVREIVKVPASRGFFARLFGFTGETGCQEE